jgi:hypothetical protein
MGERYLVTGVQLGMLVALPKDKRQKLIDEIIEKQFVGNSDESIEHDVSLM